MPLSIAGERHELIAVFLQPGSRIGNVDVAHLDYRNDFVEPVFLRFLGAIWRYIPHAVLGDQGSVHRVARAISRLDDGPCGWINVHFVNEFNDLGKIELSNVHVENEVVLVGVTELDPDREVTPPAVLAVSQL